MSESRNKTAIGVVGMSGRFPGANDLDTFWDNLKNGVESTTTFSDDELEEAGIRASVLSDPRCVKAAPVLRPIELFDASFFGMTVREAERIDPQQRLLLECAWEALEEAGWTRGPRRGPVGVYVGAGLSSYLDPRMEGINIVTELENLLGNDKDYAATRLSYKLDLHGPSLTVQTACSTSLVAIHLACQALLNGECDLALAGGVRVRVPQPVAFLYQEGGLLSPDGRCRAFDAKANGTTFGSGVGVVALKRLEDALADGDCIDAVVQGSAVNNDGAAKVGFVAPSVEGQAAVIAEALAVAGVDAATIAYVEAHGTGTQLGDTIEIAALTRAFRARSKGRSACAVGSVKTNVGHLETAAGVAGFIKTVLAMKHGQIPPSLNFHEPNPLIDFAASPFHVNATLTEWRRNGAPRRAGVSSFGIGGTNAHVVLEEAPEANTRSLETSRVHVLPVSARGERSLRAQAERLASEIERHGGQGGWLEDASFTAAVRRNHHGDRLCAVGETSAELAGALRSFVRGGAAISDSWTGSPRRVAFVYSGQGSQWVGMGRRLQEEPAFAQRLRECDAALRGPAGFSVLQVLARDPEPSYWKRVDVIQPLLFALQVSLTAQWIAWGVEPDVVIGHSLGEVAAAVVAGSLSLEDGAHVIATRSRLVSQTCGGGRMALLELGSADAERELAKYPGVSIASHHGPDTVLVSGDREGVEALVAELEARAIFGRLVDVDYASHSAQMDGLMGELRAQLRNVRPRRAQRAQCSTLLGKLLDGEELDGEYWARNLREPVRFQQSVEMLVSSGHELFVEISPHPVLTPTLQRTLGKRGIAFGSLRRGGDEVRDLGEALARAYVSGAEIDWARRHAGHGARSVRLPAYAWTRERFWLEDAGKRGTAKAPLSDHAWLTAAPHRSAIDPGASIREGELVPQQQTHLQEHVVQGALVVAGAVWLEAALHVARAQGAAGGLEDVELTEMLALDPAAVTTVQVVSRGSSFEILSAPATETGAWTRHVRGRVAGAAPAAGEREELRAVLARCPTQIEGASFYEQVRSRGIAYGERYAGLLRLWLGDGEAVAELAAVGAEPGRWEIEPWILDACLQALGATQSPETRGTFLPVGIGRLRLGARLGDRGMVHARCRRAGESELEGEVTLYDGQGRVVLEAAGVRLRRAGRRRDEHEDWLFALEWLAKPREERSKAAQPGNWLVLGDDPLAVAVSARLAGARCVRDPAGVERALAEGAKIGGIVFLATDGAEELPDDVLRVMNLVQLLAKNAGREAPRLWVVTRGTQAARPDDAVWPRHAPLWGLVRTLVHEHPELRPSCFDLPRSPTGDDLDALVAELVGDGAEDQIALRARERFVARFMRTASEPRGPEPTRVAGARPFELETARPGTFDELVLRESARVLPGPGEIEIEVEAAGLNFLDVLLALGALPDDAPGAVARGPRLGGECAGTVVRVGAAVDRFKLGDRVLALAAGAFRSFALAPQALAAHLPDAVSFAAGAGFPIAFLTAHFALRVAAQLARGERVLIHAASTGVGLAAVQLAQLAGAEIFATAGSEAKRERLRELGIRHVMDSRTLDFARGVMDATGGEGVDVVLNSLSGEFIPKSLGLLRERGRFIELGKRDYYDDAKLGLRPFLKGLTLSLVDLRALLHARQSEVAAALADLIAALAAARLQPLPVESFSASAAADAFRHVAQAKHAGKVVIAMRDPQARIAPARRDAGLRADATYLVTGGLGGLGLAVAEDLVTRGARRVALMGRRPPSDAAEAAIARLRETGASVLVVQGDVAIAEDVARVLVTVAADTAFPLRGVVHAAAVLDDGILARQTVERFERVLAPKIAGAWNLHVATKDQALDFFVLFSSMASMLGAPGQASYAAGNAFLDALAHHRRALGLPAISINWGAWGEVGLAAAQDNRAKRAAGQGMQSLSTRQGLAAFARLLSSSAPQIAVAPLDLRQWFQAYPLAAEWRMLSALAEEPSGAAPARRTRFKDELLAARVDLRRRMLLAHLAEQVAGVLRIPAARVEPTTTLSTLGLDSLTALEFRNRLEVSLGVALRATLIWAHPTTGALAEFVAKQLGVELTTVVDDNQPVSTGQAAIAADIERMSDAEAEMALLGALDALEGAES